MLTPDQLERFDEYRPDRVAESEGRQISAEGFARVCELELGVAPRIEDVLTEMDCRTLLTGDVGEMEKLPRD